LSRRERLRRWWMRGRLALAALVLLALSMFFLAFPLLPSGRLVLEDGDIAPRDIRSPRHFTYESDLLTAAARERAEEDVDPVYTPPNTDLTGQRVERGREISDYLGSIRADPFATPAQRRAWTLAVPELADVSATVVDQLYGLSDESWDRVRTEMLGVIARVMRQGVREGMIEEGRERIWALVGLDLSLDEVEVTAALAEELIVANRFYDAEATRDALARARDEVPVVLRTFDVNQIIVGDGQQVEALDVEALRQLGLQQPRTRWTDVVGAGALAVVGIAALGLVLSRFQPDVLWEGRKLLLLLLLMSLFLALARLMIPDRTVLRYLFPGPALAMLAASVLGPHAGVIAALLMGGAVGLIGNNSLELACYVVAGGLVAALALRRADRLGLLFRAAGFVSLAHVLVVIGFNLPLQRTDPLPIDLALVLMTALVSGGVSASMALGGLFVIGPLFDVATTFRLIELSHPEHPLLQRLLREAPGTYHHSLSVASLAEQAAERIGADVMLTRVGAYYHDIGKIARPYFFVENQLQGVNPHDQLDPYASAEVIIGHVRDGVDLARRHRLPSRVRAFIPEHHGSSRASFLYRRAVELAGNPEMVDEAKFRHRGRKPQSRETALVMLADRSEAVVRARRPSTPEELSATIHQVFEQTAKSGQLDECQLTMRELGMVRESFISALRGLFHPRIRYPEPPSEDRPSAVEAQRTVEIHTRE
jgi:putative nucleotidyltransferase with HDIG domain